MVYFPLFKEAFNYFNENPYKFNCYLDNICIYKWEDNTCIEDNTWNLHKEFIIKNKFKF